MHMHSATKSPLNFDGRVILSTALFIVMEF